MTMLPKLPMRPAHTLRDTPPGTRPAPAVIAVLLAAAAWGWSSAYAQTATAVPMTAPSASATAVPMTAPSASALAVAAPGDAANPAAKSGSQSQSASSGAPGMAPGAGSGTAAPAGSTAAPAIAQAAPVAASATAAPAAASPPPPPPQPKPPQTALTPVEARITDQAIRGDMAFIRSRQSRLKALNDSGDNPNTSYHYAKALHWVDFALDEYEMKNRSGVIEQALDEGDKLIIALEAKRSDMSMQTPILPLSTKVRDDLWAAAERMKADKDGFKCAGGDIARMEVQLVWAGHIQRDLGWRSAKPHLQAAERYYRDAVAGAETCPRPVPVATPAAEKRATDDAALAKLPPAKQIEILADRVHFAYDRANISVATAPILDRVASLLRANGAISVVIEGHADERGSETYNIKLSQRRADAVRAYLVAAGVEAARLRTQAFGKSKPEVKASGTSGDIEGHALNRRVVFVPSVATDLKVNPQREDLQLEKARSGRTRASK